MEIKFLIYSDSSLSEKKANEIVSKTFQALREVIEEPFSTRIISKHQFVDTLDESDSFLEYYFRNPNNGMMGKYRLTTHQLAFALSCLNNLNEWALYLSTLKPVGEWRDKHTKKWEENSDSIDTI